MYNSDFSDKNKSGSSSGKNGSEDYLHTDYFDENFSLNFKKGKGNPQSFNQEKQDDELFSSFVKDAFSGSPISGKKKQDLDATARPGYTPQNTAARSTTGASRRTGATGTFSYDEASRTPKGRKVGENVAQSRPARSAPPKKAAKPRKKGKVITIILAVAIVTVLGIIAAVAGYGYSMLGGLNYDNTIVNDRYLDPSVPTSDSVTNILLIGSDARGESSGQRSDTMILFTVDEEHKQLKLTSFLRDSYVYIPCIERYGKMNASFSKGGAQGVIDTIEYNFGIDVHDYVSVDFETFEMIVDLMGGVTVDGVTEKEARYMNSEARTSIVAGTNHMDGYEALWYCRIRKLDSDFYRTQRQRKVLTAIINQAKGTNYTELLGILEQVLPYISTSLTKNEIMSLGTKAIMNYMGYEIVQQQIPADGTWSDGNVNGSYVIDFDIEANKELLQNFVYEKVEPEEAE